MHTALIQVRETEESKGADHEGWTKLLGEARLAASRSYRGGRLITGDLAELRALQDADPERFLVQVYADVDVLRAGDRTIRLEDGGPVVLPPVPDALRLTETESETWPHHLIQFAAPPIPEWVRRLSERDVRVIEPVGRYGLHVQGSPEAVASLGSDARLGRFLLWTHPFLPAFRVSAALQKMADPDAVVGRVQFVLITVTPPEDTAEVLRLLQTPMEPEGAHGVAGGGETLRDRGDRRDLQRLPRPSVLRPAWRSGDGRVAQQTQNDAENEQARPSARRYDAPLPSAGVVRSHSVVAGRIVVELASTAIAPLAHHPSVRWMQFVSRSPAHDGEFETQIVAGNLITSPTLPDAPFPGYRGWLDRVGLSGNGVTVAICDTGVDVNAGNNLGGHPDLAGRQAMFVDYTDGVFPTDTHGHGTHMAGAALGSGRSNETEVRGSGHYLRGLGVAPSARFVTINATATLSDPLICTWWPPVRLSAMSRDAVDWGARVMNCSWSTDRAGNTHGYSDYTRQLDALVRDPTGDGAPLDGLITVWSAGNGGERGPGSITEPKESKNAIVVGSSLNVRDPAASSVARLDPSEIADSSAQGPASDGRILPTVVAPGTNVVSALARDAAGPMIVGNVLAADGTVVTELGVPHDASYALLSGTSSAAAHVTGACALMVEWWERTRGDTGMSPALAKALLVNSAVDLVEGPEDDATLSHIPNNQQGWGRVSLENLFLQRVPELVRPLVDVAPSSDRGYRVLFDRQTFSASGEVHVHTVAPSVAEIPLRITLAWTDAPGAVGFDPALVNNLDLEVVEARTGKTYRGNGFRKGWSSASPTASFDDLNNIECVFIPQPRGMYTIRVIASSLRADARPPYSPHQPWQDYALVIDNAREATKTPVDTVALLDRSASMRVLHALAPTSVAAAQYVQIMRTGDRLSAMTFADTISHDFPTDPRTAPVHGPRVPDNASEVLRTVQGAGATAIGAGLQAAIEVARSAAPARGKTRPVIVLWSDGYETAHGASVKDTLDAYAASVGAGQPPVVIHTVAPFPAANQALLAAIANRTSGTYGYAPTESALHQINNQLLATHTGDALVANETVVVSTAPNHRTTVGVPIDTDCPRATLTVAWGDPSVFYVPGVPKSSAEIDILLIDPRGRRVPANASEVRRHVRSGLVVFEIPQPRPGRWVVALRTAGEKPLRVTVGGLIPSDRVLKISISAPGRRTTGGALVLRARVDAKGQARAGVQIEARVQLPFAVEALTPVHQDMFRDPSLQFTSKVDNVGGAEGSAEATGQGTPAGWIHARQRVLDAEAVDLFEPLEVPVALRPGDADSGKPVRRWKGRYEPANLPGTYTFIVEARGWNPSTATAWTRVGRVSVHVPGPLIGTPAMADPTGIPEPDRSKLLIVAPGEETDMDETGMTSTTVVYEAPTENQANVDVTSGIAHFTLKSAGSTIGRFIAVGGGACPYPIVTSVDPPAGKTLKSVNGFLPATDNWRINDGIWPNVMDMQLTLTTITRTGVWESYRYDTFPELGGTGTLGGNPAYRITEGGANGALIGFVRIPGKAGGGDHSWYILPERLATVTTHGAPFRVLKPNSGVAWRFTWVSPIVAEQALTYVKLTLTAL